ncbi:3-deoxy-7-phosphoheptulonate synthase [Verrucomicrobiaceae bacterium N1E253]|uniref:Phospho-2-dehydro-3-deoxyheptonate aldolase n=1 Tax=Oceaniferula marina TaxID=2748318 RepID=A0A851GB81_9BACT|nr:3-deoxy-7-phosphoheptulonate synthase [Oceaniferula marina]NWK54676.1 3-deoxy-7-phosphoheptulonate synthase [Oceaniferula marina]
MAQVTDLHISSNIPLPAPALLLSEVERSAQQAEFIAESRQHIRNILNGEDHRMLLVCGPCSIHDTKAGIEYAQRLAELADEVKHQIYVVMRVYYEKPRTTIGWKGLIMDPKLDGSDNIPEGLRQARHFLREVIDCGLPTATELLDPITPQYIADLISWSAVGARTTESQTHRQMASGLSMPLGFKNTTTGDLTAPVNAIKAATQKQTFLGVSEQGVASAVTTSGNPDCHIILRGGDDGPNYGADDVAVTGRLLKRNGLQASIMVDASHANCGKKYDRMPAVFREIVRQRCAGNTQLIGAMLESNLVAGNQSFPQPVTDLTYGQSITDECIDWDTTLQIVREAATALKQSGVVG